MRPLLVYLKKYTIKKSKAINTALPKELNSPMTTPFTVESLEFCIRILSPPEVACSPVFWPTTQACIFFMSSGRDNMVGDGDMMEVVRVFIPRRESSMIPCLISSDTLSHSYAFAGDSSHGYLNMRASVSRPARQMIRKKVGIRRKKERSLERVGCWLLIEYSSPRSEQVSASTQGSWQ